MLCLALEDGELSSDSILIHILRRSPILGARREVLCAVRLTLVEGFSVDLQHGSQHEAGAGRCHADSHLGQLVCNEQRLRQLQLPANKKQL